MLQGQQREIFRLGFLHGTFPSIPQWTSPGLIVIYFLYSQNYSNLMWYSGCLAALSLNQRSSRPSWYTDKRFVQNLAYLFQKLLWNSSLPYTKAGRRNFFRLQWQFRNLKEVLPQSEFRNFLKKYCTRTAIPHFRDRNFFSSLQLQIRKLGVILENKRARVELIYKKPEIINLALLSL